MNARSGFPSVKVETVKVLLAAAPSSPGCAPLPSTVEEISAVNISLRASSRLGLQVVELGDTSDNPSTTQSIVDNMHGVSILHLACHGKQDSINPLDSGFCLSDGKLSVDDLMRQNLSDSVLAYLSACETAKGAKGQPDQVVHLAATMLFIGFRSVVATMW